MSQVISSDLVVAGGGLAGIVTALEALRAGRSVTLVDRDRPERFGGWHAGPSAAWHWLARRCSSV